MLGACHMTGIQNEIQWSDNLSVGHEQMDFQHKSLIDLINGFGRNCLSPIEMAFNLNGLIAYAARHFADEEEFLLTHAPQLLLSQVNSHAQFIEKSYDFAKRFGEADDESLRQQVYEYLCEWLLCHIQCEDQQYNQGL